MLRPLRLPPSQNTPRVHLDAQKGVFQIAGRSMPDIAVNFYKQIIEWLEQYAENPNPSTIFEFEYEYFSTPAHACTIQILNILDRIYEKTQNVQIKWVFDEDDSDMEDLGIDYQKYNITNPISFEFISKR